MTKATRAKKVRNEPKLRATFTGKTPGQDEYLLTLVQNEVTFVTGDAGTGKSYMALGLACQYLLEGRYDYLVIARPAVEASSRGLGYLPGNMDDKLGPYLYPAIENMKKFLGKEIYESYSRDGIIKFESLEYMRGRTYDNTFMILEEAQNCTINQISMFVTRIGENSKILINGDVNQTDLKNSGDSSDLMFVINKIQNANLNDFGIAHLTESDIVRNPLIIDFLRAMRH
jgi:phosphate starvation-inducible protein PhoH and related proteins